MLSTHAVPFPCRLPTRWRLVWSTTASTSRSLSATTSVCYSCPRVCAVGVQLLMRVVWVSADNSGVKNAQDPRFKSTFEDVFNGASLQAPKYAFWVLGGVRTLRISSYAPTTMISSLRFLHSVSPRRTTTTTATSLARLITLKCRPAGTTPLCTTHSPRRRLTARPSR